MDDYTKSEINENDEEYYMFLKEDEDFDYNE